MKQRKPHKTINGKTVLVVACVLAFAVYFGSQQKTAAGAALAGAGAALYFLLPGPGSKEKGSGGGTGAGEDGERPEIAAPEPADAEEEGYESLVARSRDLAASLADYARHAHAGSFARALVERAGVDTAAGPRAEAKRLGHNDRWWLWSEGELDEAAYDRMLSLELLLNLTDDLRRAGRASGLDARGVDVGEAVDAALRAVARLEPVGGASERARYYAEGAEKDGEWAARVAIADFAESLPAPLRVDIALQVNVADGIAVVDVEVPRPAVFAVASPDPAGRAERARTYAMGLCLTLSRGAFGASGRIGRVVVNAHEHGTRTPVMSLDLTPEGLGRLAEELRGMPQGELPRGLGVRWHAVADGTLAPVDAIMEVWDDAVAPLSRWKEVEENRAPASRAVAAAASAEKVCDLGIYERAVRIEAWNEASGWLGATTTRAVAAFEARRRSTTELTVADACERVRRALLDGEVDVYDRASMALLFVEGGELAETVHGVAQDLNAKPTHSAEELEAELARLEAALDPARETARYLDDTEHVFRFFNSVPERVRYNRMHEGDVRELRLVPDEYYGAHSQAAQILTALGRAEDALAHADELVRVAPVSPDAALVRVRCLEELSRIYDAEAQLKDAIGYASCLHDLALCFYRLAFMEWKLGRGRASAACYRRAADLHVGVRERSLQELREMVEEEPGADVAEDDVEGVLAEAGIPFGDVEDIRTMARDAAVACTDAGLLSAARPLAGVLVEACRDDVLRDVYESLVPRPQ